MLTSVNKNVLQAGSAEANWSLENFVALLGANCDDRDGCAGKFFWRPPRHKIPVAEKPQWQDNACSRHPRHERFSCRGQNGYAKWRSHKLVHPPSLLSRLCNKVHFTRLWKIYQILSFEKSFNKKWDNYHKIEPHEMEIGISWLKKRVEVMIAICLWNDLRFSLQSLSQTSVI